MCLSTKPNTKQFIQYTVHTSQHDTQQPTYKAAQNTNNSQTYHTSLMKQQTVDC